MKKTAVKAALPRRVADHHVGSERQHTKHAAIYAPRRWATLRKSSVGLRNLFCVDDKVMISGTTRLTQAAHHTIHSPPVPPGYHASRRLFDDHVHFHRHRLAVGG